MKNKINTSNKFKFNFPNKFLQKCVLFYPILVVSALIVAASVIFISELFITETTGICDTHKDCYATDLISGKDSEKLQYESCNDYLANNTIVIVCYSVSFNYLSAISKAGSVIAFGLFWQTLVLSELGTSMFIAKEGGTKGLKIAACFFVIVNILTLIFFILSQIGIYVVYNHYIPFVSIKQMFEIYVGYIGMMYFTIFGPIFIASIIFCVFYHKYSKKFKLITKIENDIIRIKEINFSKEDRIEMKINFTRIMDNNHNVMDLIKETIQEKPLEIVYEELFEYTCL